MIPETLIIEVLVHISDRWDRDKLPIITPSQCPIGLEGGSDWGKLQRYLKVLAYINQDGKCLCGQLLAGDYDLHHALVTRKDVQGTQFPELIHHSYNVLLLHRPCHIQATRPKCFELLSTLYGEEEIDFWLTRLPYKTKYSIASFG